MKSILILPLLAFAIIAAAILHARKPATSAQEIGIGRLNKQFRELQNILPANANISLLTADVSSEVSFWGRYLLAYPYGVADKQDKLDTTITICSMHSKDSVLHTITDGRRVLWAKADDEYRYFLTCKP